MFYISEGSPGSFCSISICFRHKQGRKGMKITAVELTDMTESDSKEEQDTATSVDNICCERVPSKLNISHHRLQFSYIYMN